MGNKGVPHTEASRLKISNGLKGKPFSPQHRLRISLALKGKAKAGEHLRHIRETNSSAGHRLKISAALKGRVFSDQHRSALRDAFRHSEIAHKRMDRLHRNYCSAIELFFKDLLECSQRHRFIHQGVIPGMSRLLNRRHSFDFVLPDKRLAIEIDGTYWHDYDKGRSDLVKELEEADCANELGWRVIRIPESVIVQIPRFKQFRKRLRSVAQNKRTENSNLSEEKGTCEM